AWHIPTAARTRRCEVAPPSVKTRCRVTTRQTPDESPAELGLPSRVSTAVHGWTGHASRGRAGRHTIGRLASSSGLGSAATRRRCRARPALLDLMLRVHLGTAIPPHLPAQSRLFLFPLAMDEGYGDTWSVRGGSIAGYGEKGPSES